jgi:hypothetical protein
MAAHAAIWKAAEVFTALGFVITPVVATEALVVGKFGRDHVALMVLSLRDLSLD